MKRMELMMLTSTLFLFAQIAQADWTPVKRITWNSGDSLHPAIAIDSSGYLHAVWDDATPGNPEILYRKSTDGGTTWTSSKRLTWNSGGSYNPHIAVDSSGNPYVVWFDYTPGNVQIYYTKSPDGGTTWASSRRLTWNSGFCVNPAIAVDSSKHLHVVWNDLTAGKEEIFYRKSTDGGATWTSSKRLTWNPGSSSYPDIAIDSSDNLHVVWQDFTPGNGEIYYRKSSDGGATWASSKRLTWNSGWSQYPAVTLDSLSHLHLVWQDYPAANEEVYYRKSTDGGTTWTSSKRLTWNPDNSNYPAVAADSPADLFVVWEDYTPGIAEIYYRKSTDGGASWTPVKRLTWTSGHSLEPASAVDSFGNLHAVWYDRTPGNYEIYYKKGH